MPESDILKAAMQMVPGAALLVILVVLLVVLWKYVVKPAWDTQYARSKERLESERVIASAQRVTAESFERMTTAMSVLTEKHDRIMSRHEQAVVQFEKHIDHLRRG